MAMMLGAQRPSANLNVTPMIDILLVLIVIFMVMPRLEVTRGEPAVIPQPAGKQPNPGDQSVIVMQLTGDALNPSVLLNHAPVAWAELERRLAQIYAGRSRRVLFLKADEGVFFDPVAQAINVARLAVPGIRVALVTSGLRSGPS
jgi:biopolymer transport protein TolR